LTTNKNKTIFATRTQMKYQILQGDNRETLKTLADNSIDAIVTDPPYGIDFLGKSWDANTGALETYQECLRVLKPGGHILAFSAARTYHHLAVTLEQAGFEIRDQIMWIYSSGFPKSQDVGKQLDKKKIDNKWKGWGTCLKPAHEPIALARKPIKGSIKDNVLKHGVGALNIDATRIPYEDQKDIDTYLNNKRGPMERGNDEDGKNIRMFNGETGFKAVKREVTVEQDLPELGRFPSNVIGEIEEPYQKYFYCPKVSRKERHIGFDPNSQGVIIDSEVFGKTPVCLDCGKTRNGSTKHDGCDPANIGFQERRTQRSTEVGNNHPTVKPIELMKYLIKLITPPGGIVLDPFNGSGSTGCAAVALGYEYIGCELDPNYVEITQRRIEAWTKPNNNFETLFE
jgi:site-specific DNA-methyltransferase (adenine-specific)